MTDDIQADVIVGPQGTTIVYLDGERVPCELVYGGLKGGIHQWEITTTIDLARLDHIHLDVMPAKSSITIPIREE